MSGPPPPPNMMAPPPWDPAYAAWYSQWWYSQAQYSQLQQARPPPPPRPAAPPPPPPPEVSAQPPPPGGEEEEEPPAKKSSLDLAAPPPPPEWQAAKKGAVIYKTPRPPTPEPPKPSEPAVLPPPRLVEVSELPKVEPEKKSMQWFFDGESWVFALQQPPIKPPKPKEDPVSSAVMANIRGKYSKPDKPKVQPARCEVCNLTVSCQKTLQSHMAGRPHNKRLAQLERIKQLEEKVKVDTERAMNSVPGGNRPGNPLQSQPNGDIHCTVCDVTMNSGAQAQSHIGGVKHRTRMDRTFRSFRGRGFGRGFGGWSGRGGHWGGPWDGPFGPMGGPMGGPMRGRGRGVGPPHFPMASAVCTSEEADEEYERVLAEALADNVELKEASARAEAAKQAALRMISPAQEEDSQEEEEGTIPTQSDQSRGRGKIYRGKANATSDGTLKAQRGRRGLISYGELIPDKLTKGQKKAQPKDIASIIAQKTAEAGLDNDGSVKKHAPLLMNFVRGGVMEGNQ